MKLLRRSAAPLKKMITVDATILHSASPLLSLSTALSLALRRPRRRPPRPFDGGHGDGVRRDRHKFVIGVNERTNERERRIDGWMRENERKMGWAHHTSTFEGGGTGSASNGMEAMMSIVVW